MTGTPRTAVVVDSACDLDPGVAAAHGIRIVPLTVAFGDEALLDGVDLTTSSFWSRVEGEPGHPTTASPSPEALARAYRDAAAEGARGIVSIHLSARLSRTLETARAAAADAPVPTEVVDSRSVSAGEALVALAASQVADGRSPSDVAAIARSAAERVTMAAALDTVEFLKRGGRMGRGVATLSDLLRIRPVVSLDGGEPVLVARSRTRGRALEEVLRIASGRCEAAAVFHSGAPEVQAVAGHLRDTCGVEPLVGWIGPVTGAHLGPRAIGVATIRRH